ncbi:MAG: YncE family protein, partial [Candidatus Binatia bacterium]
NVLSADGKRVYNGGIGNVLLPEEARSERPEALDAVVPPPYQLTIADAATLEIVGTHRFERGIRPFVLTPDEKRMYAQLSFLHGIVEYDLEEGRISRTLELPVDEGVTSDDYDFEAPHHGLALSADGELLCAAGRASDYVALVSTETFAPVAMIEVADAPGWAENGPDGTDCWIASTRADRVSVISYAERAMVAEIAVAGGPKYLLAAEVPEVVIGGP